MRKSGFSPVHPSNITLFAGAALATGLMTSTTIHAALVINEVDYDQPGSDEAEFIELYNSGSTAIDLTGLHIDLINGYNSTAYRSIDLSGFSVAADDYFVLCSDNGLVANCDYGFTSSTGWFQNGAPDAIVLYDTDIPRDIVSYEGDMGIFTEGDPLDIADSNSVIMSLARLPDGIDTDNNLGDFQQACITPGTANIAGTGDCSHPDVSPVPIPAAIWLFGSGLLGLGFTARRSTGV